jgi:hypothetical protein
VTAYGRHTGTQRLRQSTGFEQPAVEEPVLDPADEALACRMQVHYEAMAAFKLI